MPLPNIVSAPLRLSEYTCVKGLIIVCACNTELSSIKAKVTEVTFLVKCVSILFLFEVKEMAHRGMGGKCFFEDNQK
jgi:hypothetical protein